MVSDNISKHCLHPDPKFPIWTEHFYLKVLKISQLDIPQIHTFSTFAFYSIVPVSPNEELRSHLFCHSLSLHIQLVIKYCHHLPDLSLICILPSSSALALINTSHFRNCGHLVWRDNKSLDTGFTAPVLPVPILATMGEENQDGTSALALDLPLPHRVIARKASYLLGLQFPRL